MLDFFFSLSVNTVFIVLIVLILAKTKQISIAPKWAGISFLLFMGYFLAVVMGSSIIPIGMVIPDLSYNWGGKIASIILWVILLFAFTKFNAGFKLANAGFTLRQKSGSFRPAMIVLVLFILLQLILSILLGDGPNYSMESLFFQATMPGLDEEPMFRGLLLYTLSLAVVSKEFNLGGAKINIAGLLLTLLFGLAHGVMFSNGEWHFSSLSILLTGGYGFILLWLRERTGSLVFPIVAHNLVNFSGLFV